MDLQIKARFNDAILHDVLRRYGAAENQTRPLDGFMNFVYEFRRGADEYILRIGHSYRRSKALIQGEADWLNHLADGGAPVARAILSENGELVESFDDGQGGQFLATAFVKLDGGRPQKAHWQDPDFYAQYGRALGRMHALSKRYEPSNPAWKRPDWDDPHILEVESSLPASDTVVLEKFRALKRHLDTLPKSRDVYGMNHMDAHSDNFFVDQTGTITFFDFDECAYSWYAYDIAVVLFFIVTDFDDPVGWMRKFTPAFLRGYRQETEFDPVWLKEIPNFMKLIEIEMYAVMHVDFDVDNIDDPWAARYMEGRQTCIENDVPYVDFDFKTL